MSPVSEIVDSRAHVVGAPANARLLVVAGPGTGKTHTLLRRALYLEREQDLQTASELLIMGFSRATVEAITVRSTGSDLGRLPVRTLDSFASSLLRNLGHDVQGSFDARIRAATKLIESREADEQLTNLRHMLVDEAQDVVGVRLELVQLLLLKVAQNAAAGFTVFGDPAQAIYDFQAFDGDTRNLLDTFEDGELDAERQALTINHRMKGEGLAELASAYGKRIRDPLSDKEVLHEDLKAALEERAEWSAPTGLRAELDFEFSGRQAEDMSIAVLCRRNSQVLAIATELIHAGLPVRVQHRAADRGCAPWVATAFGSAPFTRAQLPPEGNSAYPQPEDALRRLRQAGVASHEVDLGRLSSLIRMRACPQDLVLHADAAITVSTIHRAKGLEFDVVYVIDESWQPDDSSAEEEARVLYVAATRAVHQLSSGPGPETNGPTRLDRRVERVVVGRWRKPDHVTQLEVRVSDAEDGWSGRSPDEHRQVQRYLESEVRRGDPLELHLDTESEGSFPRYLVKHRAQTVGWTGEQFGRDMASLVSGQPPRVLQRVFADVPDTAAMGQADAARAGIGRHGLHLRIRPFGLAELRWS